MTPTDREALRELAGAATPGRRTIEEYAHHWELYAGRDGQHHGYKLIKAPKDDPEVECYWPSAADSAYLAALSPDVTLALLDRLDALEAALVDIATMLPGSVPLPMTEEQYLRAMLHEVVRKALAALAAGHAR